MWRTTAWWARPNRTPPNFNPRPPCGGRHIPPTSIDTVPKISIHVLRVEDDAHPDPAGGDPYHFNPRPPCGGRPGLFLCSFLLNHFNPRPPCGGRPEENAESAERCAFQSTSSVWRTTSTHNRVLKLFSISIHVLRVEDDAVPRPLMLLPCPFQSTSSVWRTTAKAGRIIDRGQFQSTSSVWRTTLRPCKVSSQWKNFNPRPPCGGRLRL